VTRALAGNVWVDDVLYKAGTVPPPDVAERITNPKAWNAPAPEQVVESGSPEPAPASAPKSDVFDPSDHSVVEVREYLAQADDSEKERVLASEASGKARTSLTG
jgi:hypothetical protein